MPEARIFLYVYNSKLIYGGEKELFIEKADDLLNDIRNQRKKVRNPRYPCEEFIYTLDLKPPDHFHRP